MDYYESDSTKGVNVLIVGNISLGLASLGLILIILTVATSGGGGVNDTGGAFILFFLSLPMCVAFSAAYCAAVAAGKLDWLGWPREAQYLGVIVSCLALTTIMAISAAIHGGASGDLPWPIELTRTWAAVAVPAVLIGIGFLWWNSDLVPAPVLGRAFVGLSAFAVAAVGVTLLVWMFRSAAESAEKGQAEIRSIERQNSVEDRKNLEKAQSADPEKDFDTLLSLANRFHTPETRKLALEKVLSTGDKFVPRLSEVLRSEYNYTIALRFLSDCEVPDRRAVGEPVRDAILIAATLLRRDTNHFPDEIDRDNETILEVADRMTVAGVDLVPAIREYRSALDTVTVNKPRTADRMKPHLASTGNTDRWLKKHK